MLQAKQAHAETQRWQRRKEEIGLDFASLPSLRLCVNILTGKHDSLLLFHRSPLSGATLMHQTMTVEFERLSVQLLKSSGYSPANRIFSAVTLLVSVVKVIMRNGSGKGFIKVTVNFYGDNGSAVAVNHVQHPM